MAQPRPWLKWTIIGLGLSCLIGVAVGGYMLSTSLLKAPSQDQGSAGGDFVRPGGDTTIDNFTPQAFAQPIPNMSAERSDPHFIGNSLFNKNWITAPGSAKTRDGLGPLFNARSCSACHFKDGRGQVPNEDDPDRAGLLFKVAVVNAAGEQSPHPTYGGQLQDHAIEGVRAEGKVSIRYQKLSGEYGDGASYVLRKPIYEVTDPGYGAFGPVILAPRMAPQVFGVGLLEAIDQGDLYRLADPDDLDGDGVSGRVAELRDPESNEIRAVGRFGWKAGQPGVDTQSAAAFNGDIGISSPLVHTQNHTAAQGELDALPLGGTPEIEDRLFDAVVFYMRTLAVPNRRLGHGLVIDKGEELFHEAGCASCHTPVQRTTKDFLVPELRDQEFAPYTDLLLHDMGEGLADGLSEGAANGSEWRTPPLWGIGLISVVNGHNELLHDGRAQGVAEAILWHGGEGEKAKEKFRAMSALDRTALIAFVKDL